MFVFQDLNQSVWLEIDKVVNFKTWKLYIPQTLSFNTAPKGQRECLEMMQGIDLHGDITGGMDSAEAIRGQTGPTCASVSSLERLLRILCICLAHVLNDEDVLRMGIMFVEGDQ